MRFDELRVVQASGTEVEDGPRREQLLSVSDVVSFFRHFWPLIACTALFCALLAAAYVLVATPTYTAVAQLLIETSQSTTPTTISTPESAIALDTPQIESEIALLGSEQIVERAAKIIDGTANDNKKSTPSSDGSATSLDSVAAPASSGWLYKLIFGSPPVPVPGSEERSRVRNQIAKIQGNLSVKRVGLSYVLELSYRATDPKTAAAVVNALGDAYVQDKIDGRVEAARRSSIWLETRIEEIRRLMNEAAIDVQEFKARRDYRLADRPETSGGEGALGLDLLPKANDGSKPATKDDGPEAPPKKDERMTSPRDAPTLEELDSRALTYRKIYESYLQAYTDIVQRQSYPGTTSRVISRAEPPSARSSPRRMLTLLGSVVLGTLLGVGIALVKAAFDETVRSSHQLLKNFGVPLFGEIDNTHSLLRLPLLGRGSIQRRRAADAVIVLKRPNSRAARKLASTAAEIATVARSTGIGMVGIFGVSRNVDDAAICSNIALLNAQAGKRTLLIEADTGPTNLTTVFAPNLQFDLKDVLDSGVQPADAIVTYGKEGLLSLLCLRNRETSDFWTHGRIEKLRDVVNLLGANYDNIFLHLPPASEGDLTVSAADGVVLVGELWRTKMSAIEEVVSRLRIAGRPLLGIVTAKLS